jgi:hypothetical protein
LQRLVMDTHPGASGWGSIVMGSLPCSECVLFFTLHLGSVHSGEFGGSLVAGGLSFFFFLPCSWEEIWQQVLTFGSLSLLLLWQPAVEPVVGMGGWFASGLTTVFSSLVVGTGAVWVGAAKSLSGWIVSVEVAVVPHHWPSIPQQPGPLGVPHHDSLSHTFQPSARRATIIPSSFPAARPGTRTAVGLAASCTDQPSEASQPPRRLSNCHSRHCATGQPQSAHD